MSKVLKLAAFFGVIGLCLYVPLLYTSYMFLVGLILIWIGVACFLMGIVELLRG